MPDDPGAPPRGQPPRGDPARLTPGRWPGVLPRQVKLFGWVSLLNDFASEMIYPLLPAFVTGVLGAGPQGGGARGRPVFGWGIVRGVAVLVVAGWAVSDGAATGGSGRQQAANASEPMPPAAALSRPLPPPLLAISFFYLLRMPDTLIILRSQELGVPVAIVPLLWAAVHVVRSSSSFLGGAASDRLGRGQTVWLGWLVYALLAGGLARAGTAAAAWGLFLALG